jgi:hypothetical protein
MAVVPVALEVRLSRIKVGVVIVTGAFHEHRETVAGFPEWDFLPNHSSNAFQHDGCIWYLPVPFLVHLVTNSTALIFFDDRSVYPTSLLSSA